MFNLECPYTEPGDRVYAAGSVPELGSWDPLRALPLTTSAQAFPVWQGAIRVSCASSNQIEIKFYILKHKGSKIVWEQLGQNRVLIISGLAANTGVAFEGHFQYKQAWRDPTQAFSLFSAEQFGLMGLPDNLSDHSEKSSDS